MNALSQPRRVRATRRSATVLTCLVSVLALVLAACGSSDDDKDKNGDAASPAAGPVDLTYWTWMTNIEDVVDIWNKEHPDIQVSVDRLAEGDDLVTRIVTAAKAGNLPDMMQVEYQSLPILVSNEVVADLTDVVAPLQDTMPASAWEQVTWGGTTYAIPGDIGPLMMYVRTDRFKELGISVPTTWDEFAQAAAAVRAADPKAYLSSFDATYPGWFAGLAQQAGAQWWTTDNDSWGVAIDDEATEQVADFWSSLLADGDLSTSPTYSAEWNSAMADGSILSWIAPVWGAGVIQGTAPDTAGKWRAVPLPQYTAGETVSGYWGGSSSAVSADTDHADQATQFLTWLYTDPEALAALVDVAGLYPAALDGQDYAAGTGAPEILEGQDDFWQLAAEAAANAQGFQWSPNVNFTFTTMQDAFSTAVEKGTSLRDTLPEIEKASRDDLASQGYPVAE
jgi:multiple sugar transport system substrate-binding protein